MDATEKQKTLKSVGYQLEALESGFDELIQWLDGADDLLMSHRIDGDITSVEERLGNHMASSNTQLNIKSNYFMMALHLLWQHAIVWDNTFTYQCILFSHMHVLLYCIVS